MRILLVSRQSADLRTTLHLRVGRLQNAHFVSQSTREIRICVTQMRIWEID